MNETRNPIAGPESQYDRRQGRCRLPTSIWFIGFVALALVGCANLPPHTRKIPTLRAVDDPIHFRTSVADLALNFSEVEATLKASTFAPDARSRFIRLLHERKAQEYFTQSWPQDEVGYAIYEVVLPPLLAKGHVMVTDLKSHRVAAFICAGWSSRGVIGPYYCLPTGQEFFRDEIMVE